MILDRKTAPERLASASIPILNHQPIKLTDNLECYRVEGGTEDIVKIDIVFKAGTRYEQKPLTSTICLNTLKEGTENYSAKEIADTTDFYGAQIATNLTKDRAEVTLLCQTKHLNKLIDIFTDIFLLPVFPEEEIEQYKKRSSSTLAVNLDKVEFQSRLLFSQLMFQGTPYRDIYDLKDYANIRATDLQEFFANFYNFADSFCVISGKNTQLAAETLGRAISKKSKRRGKEILSGEAVNWSYVPGEKWNKKDEAVQTAIRMGVPALSRNHPHYTALYIANTALGGYFGSRLMQNIREEKGYTYGIGSAINALEELSYLSISTQVGAEFSKLTVNEIKKEVHGIATQPIKADEFELIQHYIAGNLLKRFDGPFATADRLKSLISYNLPADWYTVFSKALFELNPIDICEISRVYLHTDLFSLAVVGEWPE